MRIVSSRCVSIEETEHSVEGGMIVLRRRDFHLKRVPTTYLVQRRRFVAMFASATEWGKLCDLCSLSQLSFLANVAQPEMVLSGQMSPFQQRFFFFSNSFKARCCIHRRKSIFGNLVLVSPPKDLLSWDYQRHLLFNRRLSNYSKPLQCDIFAICKIFARLSNRLK